jgi:hemoglobin-like flavoprotein
MVDYDMQIHESLEKILESKEAVVDLFYDEFLDRHPGIREYFRGIDMKRQSMQLTMALMLVVHHYNHRYATTASYLMELGRQHDERRKIPAATYPMFRDCLLETLQRFHGEEWDEALAEQWCHALDLAAATMLGGYGSGVKGQ